MREGKATALRPPLPTLPWLRKLTHNTQEQEDAEPHGGLRPRSARKGGVSELTPSVLPPLPPLLPPFLQATPSLPSSDPSSPVCQSLCLLCCLPVHLPTCPSICRSAPSVHLSRMMPHLIPQPQLLQFPCGVGWKRMRKTGQGRAWF